MGRVVRGTSAMQEHKIVWDIVILAIDGDYEMIIIIHILWGVKEYLYLTHSLYLTRSLSTLIKTWTKMKNHKRDWWDTEHKIHENWLMLGSISTYYEGGSHTYWLVCLLTTHVVECMLCFQVYTHSTALCINVHLVISF